VHLLGKQFTTWTLHPDLLALAILQTGSQPFCPGPALDFSPPIYTFQIAGIQSRVTMPSLFFKIGSSQLFAWLDLNTQFSIFASYLPGIIGMHHHAQQLFFPFFLFLLRVELRASCLLGSHSITWATLPALFCVSYFWDRVCFMPRLAWNTNLLFVLPQTAAQSWVQMRGEGFRIFCPGWLWTISLPISTSSDIGIIGLSHHGWSQQFFLWIAHFFWFVQEISGGLLLTSLGVSPGTSLATVSQLMVWGTPING
jgi:hypothetical protein